MRQHEIRPTLKRLDPPMSFDDIDVQWTVISRSEISAALTAIDTCASAVGWRFERGEVTTSDGTPLAVPGPMASETFGTGTCFKPSQPTKFSLFWSTFSRDGLTKFTGGLYLKQYAEPDKKSSLACERAFADLRTLFANDEVLCVVLALEDDEGIDIGPGIVGWYRSLLWRVAANLSLPGLLIEEMSDSVVVRPMGDGKQAEVEPRSVFTMPEPAQSSIQKVQAVLSKEIWGNSKGS